MSINLVILQGNLTRDPELKTLASGNTVGKFTIASNRSYKSGDEWQEEVAFVDITVWGRQAEKCGEILEKGRSVLIEGRLKQENWETDGQKRRKLTVVANKVNFLPSKNSNDVPDVLGTPQTDQAPITPPVAQLQNDSAPGIGKDEEIPF